MDRMDSDAVRVAREMLRGLDAAIDADPALAARQRGERETIEELWPCSSSRARSRRA